MKRTPFIISLMAALLGIQPALAAVFDGGTANPDNKTYIGLYSETAPESEFGNVSISDGDGPDDYTVFGSYIYGEGQDASLSTVTMYGGTVTGVYGGYSAHSHANWNEVKQIDGKINGNVYGGYSAGTGTTENNTVTLNGEAKYVYGGISGAEAVPFTIGGGSTSDELIYEVDAEEMPNGSPAPPHSTKNKVTVGESGQVDEVIGGASKYSYSTGNQVDICGTVNQLVVGGVSLGTDKSSYSTGNAVTIGGNAKVAVITVGGDVVGNASEFSDYYYVCGGAAVGSVTKNSVTISGDALVGCEVYGGYSGTAGKLVGQNTVTVEGGTTFAAVYGGYGAGTTRKNEVTISGGTIKEEVFGGNSLQGYAIGNVVSISGGSVLDTVVAGQSRLGKAYDNSVEITGGELEAVYGAKGELETYSNTVVISGSGTVVAGEVVAGQSSTRKAYNNSVGITGGQLGGNVLGARAGIAENNRVVVTAGTVAGVLAGAVATESAAGNEVHLVGGGVQVSLEDNSVANPDDMPLDELNVANGEPGVTEYTGGNMQLGDVYGAICTDPTKSIDNSIDVYGYGICAKSLQGMQELNFHMVNASKNDDAYPMVILENAGEASGLVLGSDLVLNFDAMDEMIWQPGDAVTLVSSRLGITVDPYLLSQKYDIYQYDDPYKVVQGTGVLKLEQGGTVLKLVIPMVPEPATGTLGLLALAALAARRRRQ